MSHMDKDKLEILGQLSELAAKAGVVAFVMRTGEDEYAIAIQRNHIESLGYDMGDLLDATRGRLSVMGDIIALAEDAEAELLEQSPEIDLATLCNCEECVRERRGAVH